MALSGNALGHGSILYTGLGYRVRTTAAPPLIRSSIPVSKENDPLYKLLGWQPLTGTEEEIRQAEFVTRFFDFYENSYLEP